MSYSQNVQSEVLTPSTSQSLVEPRPLPPGNAPEREERASPTVPRAIIITYQWIMGLFFVFFLSYLLFLFTSHDVTQNGMLRGISDIFVLVGAAICTIACFSSVVVIRRIHKVMPGILTGRAWVGWVFLGLAALSYAIGQGIWTSYDIRPEALPFPASYDIFYLLVYPFSWIGIALLIPRGTSIAGRTRLLLDACIAVASAATVFWYYILGPTISTLSGEPLAKVVALSYPIGDLSLCVAAAFLVFGPSSSAALSGSMGRLAIGVTILAITDSLYAYFILLGQYHTGLLQDIGWPISWLFVGLAALTFPAGLQRLTGQHMQSDLSGHVGQISTLGAALRATVPMILALLTCALLLIEVGMRNPDQFLQVVIVCAVLFLLPVVRQMLTLVDNFLLNERLRLALNQSQRAFQQSQQALINTSSRAEQYEELRAGIEDLQAVHARLARGDMTARAQVKGPLAPAAQSLNLLVERMSRWAHSVQTSQRQEREAQYLQQALATLSEGRLSSALSVSRNPHSTGGALLSAMQLQNRLRMNFGRLRELVYLVATQWRVSIDLVTKAQQAMRTRQDLQEQIQIANEAFLHLEKRLLYQQQLLQELQEKASLYDKEEYISSRSSPL